ncbi:ATP-binding cassette domain-containing protein [Dactylosporangium sp. AC04546]|uniref:ABC transporter ATP-binding protein/permease n=1 Tax=Dactylosporangium sp. AC04546 TaxID=2862460 RepID=UPI001EDD0063|nr:ATP-binding cassette domain-containing protein [Dactylosporangium sp. AC04546]WVK89257.1 ATP-binding cassette domain-containing protein [Dactylosporangium sp. AC04546]
MSRGYGGAVAKAFGARDHTLTVADIVDVTPRFRRIVFDAPTFFDGQPVEPAAWVRMWVPDGTGREHQRGYTLVDPDPDAGRISLEFLMHEPAGPACAWAKAAAPGTTVQVTRWASTHFAVPDPAPAGYLLIGDAASLPGINAILATVPPTAPVEVLLELHHEDDRQIPITPHPRSTVTWAGPSTIAAAIDGRDWSDWYAWVTGEQATVKQAKARLKELGFPAADTHGRAYWRAGKAMGTDREAAQQPARVPPAKAQWRSQAGSRLLAPLRSKLILAGVFQGVVSLLQLAPYVVLVELCRRLLAGDDDVTGLGLLALTLLGAGTALAGALVVAMHVLDARFGHRVRVDVVGKLSRMPLGWFTERGSGRVKQAVQDDAASLHYLVTHAVLDVVAALVTPLAVLVYLYTVSGWLTTVLLIPLVVFAVLTARMVQASTAQLAQFTVWEERVGAEAVAHLDGLAVVRAYDAGPASGFRSTLTERAAFLEAWQRPMSSRKTVVDLVSRPATSLVLIVVAGGGLVAAGVLRATDLLPFLLLGVTFGAQLLAAAYGMGSVREATAAARRIGLLLDEPELAVADRPRTPDSDRPVVRFERVGFSYDGEHLVLQDVDLTLTPGTVTALVGPSGAGKSTLAALLARFHDPSAGRITVGGVDLRDFAPHQLYNMIAFVFQDVALVRGTVHDNIALARPDATRDEVERAARAAGIHERITRLPDGYDTTGFRLSGGEAQRLTIARALLADPAILVLDEATAYADPESEDAVQQALSRLVAGRTVLVIAHRLHTITAADAIVVLDGGRVAQRGTHDELLARPGLYRELWQVTA